MPLKVRIPDNDYWKEQIKCQYACPVHTDARGYVRAIADGDFEKAYLIARAPNPLASICGRVCGAPCEASCRRGSIDKSISIRGLKRSAYENTQAVDKPLEMIKNIRAQLDNRECLDIEELGSFLLNVESGKFKKITGKSVGIIGSGPAGLAAAHDLALMGFMPTIYEMESVAAGMLYLGVPAYRLPRELIAAEIDVIKSLGVEIITNCAIGKDITLKELRDKHDAVVIAVGCKKSRTLPIPGANAKGVLGGVDFLRDVALNLPRDIGKKVVVVGGGNVAYDIARSALRQQQVDVAEAALFEREGVEVTLVCLEPQEQMLADEIEILEGEEEGVNRVNGFGPQEILTKNGRVKGIVFHKIISIFDDQERFNPQYDASQSLTIEADTILFAVGQSSDVSFVNSQADGIQLNERGLIICDPVTQQTSANDIYLAGDLATGPKLMIDAIASGKKVARAIYQNITGVPLQSELSVSHKPIENYNREHGYENIRRSVFETVDVKDRITEHDIVVEKGYNCGQAQIEGSRCFDCGVNTIFDGNKCILCGGCVDVCPELCLKLVPVSDLDGNKDFDELTNFMKDQKETEALTAIIKDEEMCIRCSLCAIRCPVDAITMERFTFNAQTNCAGGKK